MWMMPVAPWALRASAHLSRVMWMMPVGSMGSSRKRSSDAEQSLGTDEEDGGHDGEDYGDRGLRPEQGHQALGHAHEESRRDGPRSEERRVGQERETSSA